MKPKLKVVKLSDIIPLMDSDPARVEYLKQIVKNTGSIRNLLSLAKVSKNRFLLLEDSSIMEALHLLRIEQVPAQVIPCRKTLKFTADITAGKVRLADLKTFARVFPRAFYVPVVDLPDEYAAKCTQVKISKKDKPDIRIYFMKDDSAHLPPAIFTFLDYLKKCWSFCGNCHPARVRPVNVKGESDDSWLLSVINIGVTDLLFAADHGFLFPPRMLRFNYGHRIIGIDYPIDVLREHVPIGQKEQFLHDLVNMRLNGGFSEYIKSGVILLNY